MELLYVIIYCNDLLRLAAKVRVAATSWVSSRLEIRLAGYGSDLERHDARAAAPEAPHVEVPGGSVRGERANLKGLVLGCIEAKFCKKICVGKLSPRSTQCTPLHLSQCSKLCSKIAKMFATFFAKSCLNLTNFR